MKDRLISYLEHCITERRLGQMEKVLANRTRYITVALEDIFQPHNASAVLRSCDCFGIQDVHIIENRNKYRVNPDVALGSSKWLTLHKYNQETNNTSAAIHSLKKKGYQIVATMPGKNALSVEEYDITQGKVALLFGTEMKGLTDEAIEQSDSSLQIPMYGFTQSFNISVAAAIILYRLVYKLHLTDVSWQLNDKEKSILKLQWLKNCLKNPDALESFLIDNHNLDSEE